jgi:hypothetical protein
MRNDADATTTKASPMLLTGRNLRRKIEYGLVFAEAIAALAAGIRAIQY